MQPEYDYGDAVRVMRNVRNDGTYPGLDRGELLVKRGSVGYVKNMGTFLQDQLVYSIHFIDIDRVVGCRGEELQQKNDPWVQSRFEFRDKVVAASHFSIKGEVVVEKGTEGEVQSVFNGNKNAVFYYVRFNGRTLKIPEYMIISTIQYEPEKSGIAPAQA